MTHLGIELGKTMNATIEATLNKIQPKAIRRRILATTPPTDLLDRSRLINQALTPIYNHVFMALPVLDEQADAIFNEILSFLWTRQVDGEQVQKRRIVARN